MKTGIKQNIFIKFLAYIFMPSILFIKELFNACKGRRLTVLWIAAFFVFMYISSQYYVEKLQSKIGIAVDISNISSNDHIFFKVNKGVRTYSELNKGEYIAFNTDKLEPYISREYTVVKKVIGKEGDHIQIKNMSIFVNGKKYAELHPIILQKLNKTEKQMQTDYIVPKNSVFVLGSYERSYDSRYWGVLPVEPNKKLDIATPILF